MRRLLPALGFIWGLSCAPTPSGRAGGEAGPLDLPRLSEAARAAGFRVLDVKLDLPRAVRSRLAFVTLDYDDPRLAGVRDKYSLEKVVGAARHEWEAQLLLKEWVHRAIPNGTPKVKAYHAVDILDAAARGETFWCTYYGITYVECALALGWQARKIAVDRRHGPEGLESTHHGVAEVWSNAFRKWAVIDPQSNLHFERAGVPLSAWEIRAEWLRNGGADVDHVVGVPPKAVKKNPAVVWWNRAGEDETAGYFWLYVIDHADTTDPKARFIFPQDDANASLLWYQNNSEAKESRLHEGYRRNLFLPTREIGDAYWTVGVVEVAVAGVRPGAIELSLDAHGPGLAGFEASLDGKAWRRVTGVSWELRPGWNPLRLRTVNRAGVKGPEAALVLYLDR